MIGQVTAIQEDKKAVFVQFDEKCKFKQNESVNVSSKRFKRTPPQNRLYWAYLTWIIHPFGGDLQSQGHFSVDALHENIKAWIEAAHSHDFPIDKKFSTAGLDKKNFGRFFDLVNYELMIEILGVDTSPFFKDYEKYTKWSEYNDPDFRAFMDEKVSEVPF
jgi:hypothetical protein